MIPVKNPLFKLGQVVATPALLRRWKGPVKRRGNSWRSMLPEIGAWCVPRTLSLTIQSLKDGSRLFRRTS